MPDKYGNPLPWEGIGSAIQTFAGGAQAPAAATSVGGALAKSAPKLVSSIPGWVNPTAMGVSLAGDALGSFIGYQQAEDAERQREKEYREQVRQADRAAAFQERQYTEGAGVRAANMANQTFPALEKGMDWRARLAYLSRGA